MLTCGSVFSGIGLLDYGLHLAGIEHRWLCEWDEWRRGILAKRWPGARVLDDVRHVGHGCEPVELLAGGFPCKGASTAGKRNGFGHPETVLWREMARAIRELRPRYVLVENVANILGLHDGAVWGEVLGDLATLGYDVVWDCLPAGAVGATHLRDRVFAVASHSDGAWLEGHGGALGVQSQVAGATPDNARASADADGTHAGRDSGLWREPHGRADARGGTEDAPDSARIGASGAGGDAGGGHHPRRDSALGGREAAAHAGRGGVREQPEPERGSSSASFARRPGAAPADADNRNGRGRRAPGRVPPTAGAGDAQGRGVVVEWGDYEPAIRRWEAVHGPAPEPLVRRVDDRGTSRVERSRLSALGDGVQVQVGRIAGEYIVGLERARRGGVT